MYIYIYYKHIDKTIFTNCLIKILISHIFVQFSSFSNFISIFFLHLHMVPLRLYILFSVDKYPLYRTMFGNIGPWSIQQYLLTMLTILTSLTTDLTMLNPSLSISTKYYICLCTKLMLSKILREFSTKNA